jgi:hypothetical protein
MEACADRDLMSGVVAIIQTFGNRLNFHPHLPMLGTESGATSEVYEVDPLTCPDCGSGMKVIAFIANYETIDQIIHHLRLSFGSTRSPPPPHQQDELY